MCGRFVVDAPEHLPLSTLQGLLKEVRDFYTKQPPSAAQEMRSAPDETTDTSPPADALPGDPGAQGPSWGPESPDLWQQEEAAAGEEPAP
jgi:hypothetical protein